jgi:hypothetical protein
MDGAKVGVLEKTNKVCLGGLLKGKDGGALEAEIGLEVLGDLADEALEGELADKKLSGLLVSADLTKSHGTGAVSVGLLDTTGRGGALAGSLGGELLSGGLASSGLACGFISTGHFVIRKYAILQFSSHFNRNGSQVVNFRNHAKLQNIYYYRQYLH